MNPMFRIPKRMPRWIVLFIDAVLVTLAFALSYFTAYDFRFSYIVRGYFFIYTGLFTIIAVPVLGLLRIHLGLIRYSSLHDITRIFLATLIATALYPLMLNLIRSQIFHSLSVHMTRVLLINFFITCTSSDIISPWCKGILLLYQRA